MHMLYNSESYVVVVFEASGEVVGEAPRTPVPTAGGGYEIVDKRAGKEIYISGAMAESFKSGVEALIESEPTEDEIDDYLGRFSALMHQPVVLH